MVGAGATQRPDIPNRLLPYWRAFADLHRKRAWHSSGPQPISFEALQSYIGLKFRRPPEQIRRLLVFADALDEAYLADFAKKQQDKQGASS